jgi:hypothetical protein
MQFKKFLPSFLVLSSLLLRLPYASTYYTPLQLILYKFTHSLTYSLTHSLTCWIDTKTTDDCRSSWSGEESGGDRCGVGDSTGLWTTERVGVSAARGLRGGRHGAAGGARRRRRGRGGVGGSEGEGGGFQCGGAVRKAEREVQVSE